MKTQSLLFGISIIVFCALIGNTAHAGVKTKTEIYAVRGKSKLKIHLHFPEGWKVEDKRPGIIFFHGGSWTGGSSKKFLKQAQYFASRGMVSARVDYRVKSRDGVAPDDCVRDARSSVRWMKKNAEKLGIDPKKIITSGGSAGGHLAACMMIKNSVDAPNDDLNISTIPAAMILFNPVLSFEVPQLSSRLGKEKGLARKVSPNAHLDKNTPPALILFGSKDRLIALANTYWQEAKKLGVRAEKYIAEGQGHGFFNEPPWRERTLFAADKFLVSLGLLEDKDKRKEAVKSSSKTIKSSNGKSNSEEYIPRFTGEKGSNINSHIVKGSDSKKVTHRLKIKNVTIGFSANGGGYINYCDLGDGKNICSPFYGRGWQHSIRDLYHNHRYNPTQAGFRDHEGAPVRVIEENGKVIIPPFNLPLYSDPRYDFVEHEELIKEQDKYIKRGINTDRDGLKEKGKTGDDEIRSEFDFSGLYEDASTMVSTGIPVLRHRYFYAYVRKPAAVYQFGSKATMDDGSAVVRNKYALKDIAPGLPGNQTARETDLSYGQFTFGIRLLTKVRDLSVPWWVEKGKLVVQKEKYENNSVSWRKGKHKGGRWVVFNDKLPGQKNTAGDTIRERLAGKKTDMALMILADGTDPNTAMGIGLYVPLNSPINRKPVVGIDAKSKKIKYSDNRNMQYFFQGGQRVPIQYNLVERIWFTGLRAPTNGIIEAIYHDTFLLFGSPNEIYQSVKELEKKFSM